MPKIGQDSSYCDKALYRSYCIASTSTKLTKLENCWKPASWRKILVLDSFVFRTHCETSHLIQNNVNIENFCDDQYVEQAWIRLSRPKWLVLMFSHQNLRLEIWAAINIWTQFEKRLQVAITCISNNTKVNVYIVAFLKSNPVGHLFGVPLYTAF